MDVTLLLKSLQRTLMFERDAAQRFEGMADEEELQKVKLDENGDAIDPQSAEGIKRKHRRKKREAERKALEEEMEKNGELTDDNNQGLPTIRGMISRSFDPFMTAYVALERKNMEQMINEVMSAELVDRNGQLPVFSSSVNMFAYIRNSIKRSLLPTASRETPCCLDWALDSSSSGASNKVKLSDKQEEELCFVINTAEYCAETLPSLEEVIRAKIDKAFSEAIELSQEIDTFHDVGAAAMKCIVAGLETSLDDDLNALHKANWQTWEAVGDESLYVTQMGEKLQTFVPVLRQMLSGLYFTNFCDKFAASFVPKILQAVFKCRRMNQVATQQLLLDVYALKTLFLQLPVLNNDGFQSSSTSTSSATIPSRYTKFVSNEMATVENVLKLIGTPNEMLVESFKIMWPEGSAEDFQNIMAVKGLKKSELAAYLDTLGMQRKPTGKIAEMEGKMSDMTENWKKNMQNFAKVPFTFTGGMNTNAHQQG
ncbi:Vps53-like N-terminal domain-containing protein [Phytophthora infestans]|uniref:Vps53-like N-terminal domain-containing protein n=1 Tax=Phytophthora infestans TaxID=4787 RepID=A0A8S9UIB6_PHYIN|nr:Vps53-like N-terminal domain-containing protein [Phytophthora infestans]